MIRSFDELYGKGHLYCPAVIGKTRRWLPAMPEAMSGGQLVFFREAPYFCHAAVASRKGLDHLMESGHRLPMQIHPYDNDADLIQSLQRHVSDGWKIVANHFPFPDCLPPEAFWVDPQLVARINHKGLLQEWVSEAHLPLRTLQAPESIVDYAGPFPVVIKIASSQSCGGGTYVARCQDLRQLRAMLAKSEGADAVILEEWIDFEELWCLNYAVHGDGTVSELGAAQQLIAGDLSFLGNQFCASHVCSQDLRVTGLAVARRIQAAGYRGILGMDIGVTSSGRHFVYDINARMNASTAPLLALANHPWLRAYPTQQTVRLEHADGLEQAIRISNSAWREKRFLPLSTFDPSVAHLGGKAYVSGLINGDDPRDIRRYLDKALGQSR